jgi:hypothetical protein
MSTTEPEAPADPGLPAVDPAVVELLEALTLEPNAANLANAAAYLDAQPGGGKPQAEPAVEAAPAHSGRGRSSG